MGRTKRRKGKGPKPEELTDKERQFVEVYRACLNGTKAALEVYNCKSNASASALAAKMLKKPRVQAAVGHLQEQDRRKHEVEADEVITHLADCATRDSRLLFDRNGVLILNHYVINGRVEGRTVVDLPESITNAIDGIKQKRKRYEDSDGNLIEEIETELKLVSKASAIEMAMKHKGLFAPDKMLTGTVSLDWDELTGAKVPDPIEDRLKKENVHNGPASKNP